MGQGSCGVEGSELVTIEAAQLRAILDEIHDVRETLVRYLAPVPLPPNEPPDG